MVPENIAKIRVIFKEIKYIKVKQQLPNNTVRRNLVLYVVARSSTQEGQKG